jgi:hypothetical protein
MVKDAYGYEAGPDGRGTSEPPEKGWSIFGYFDDQADALRMARSLNQEDPQFGYQRHPQVSNALIWTRQKHLGIKVRLDPPDPKLFAYLERTYGVGHVEYLGPIGRNGADEYFCIKPDQSGGIYYSDSSNVVGRTMKNYRDEALVIGDDSVVYDELQEGTKGTSEENREPDQFLYDDFWDSVYEAVGSLVRERDEAAYKLNRNLRSWYCEVSGFGWRQQSGYKVFDVEGGDAPDHAIGTEFLREILPNTDCTYWVFDDLDGAGLKIENAHHDAPTGGEWYHCVPLAWMLMNGAWTGLQNDRDEILPEIEEVVMMEWEEFLNDTFRNESASGQRISLDIEFPTLFKRFIARYKIPIQDKHFGKFSEFATTLEDFFFRYYASSAVDEFGEWLGSPNLNGDLVDARDFLTEFNDFIKSNKFQIEDRTIPEDVYTRIRAKYKTKTGKEA